MHGVRNSPWNPILFALPNKNYYLRMRERERERERNREERDWWNLVYKPVLCISPLLYVALTVCASLFCSLYVFVVCEFALFFCICLFFSSLRPPFSFPFFFFYLCVLLSIYREIPKKLFIALLSTDRSWSSFCQFFPAQLLISCSAVTHFSAFFSFLCSVTF